MQCHENCIIFRTWNRLVAANRYETNMSKGWKSLHSVSMPYETHISKQHALLAIVYSIWNYLVVVSQLDSNCIRTTINFIARISSLKLKGQRTHVLMQQIGTILLRQISEFIIQFNSIQISFSKNRLKWFQVLIGFDLTRTHMTDQDRMNMFIALLPLDYFKNWICFSTTISTKIVQVLIQCSADWSTLWQGEWPLRHW